MVLKQSYSMIEGYSDKFIKIMYIYFSYQEYGSLFQFFIFLIIYYSFLLICYFIANTYFHKHTIQILCKSISKNLSR